MTTNYTTAQGVQQFSITISAANTTGTATINAVGSGAFILADGINPSVANNPAEDFARLTLTNSTTITATRNTSTGTVVVNGCIIDGDTTKLIKSVQYGTVTIASGASSGPATISSVTNANAAVHLLGWSSANTSFSAIGELPVVSLSGTTVTASLQSTLTAGQVVGFVVIEFQGAALNSNVQQFQASSASNVTSYPQSITSVNVNNAICIYGGAATTTNTNVSQAKQYGSLTNSTTFTVNIVSGISSKFYNCTVVEFASGVLNSAVQRGTTSLPGLTSGTTDLLALNENYSAMSWLGNSSTSTTAVLQRAEGSGALGTASTAVLLAGIGDGSGVSPLTFSVTNPSAGDLLIVAIAYSSGSAVTVTGVADNASQTWVQYPGARAADSTGGQFTDIWYFANTSASVTSITITLSSSSGALTYDYYRVSGMQTSSVVDAAGSPKNNASSSSNAVTNGVTTGSVGDFILAVAANGTSSNLASSANAPFTLGGLISAYYTPTAKVTAQSATIKFPSADTYCASIASFFSNGLKDIVTVTKNNATANITGSWEVFEFPAYVSPGGGGSFVYIGAFL